MTEAWEFVCRTSQMGTDEIFAGAIGNTMIAVYHVDGKYFATDNVCPHAFSFLSDGWLDELEVECPLHGARFNIETGALVRGPADCGIRAYKVRVQDDEIYVSINPT